MTAPAAAAYDEAAYLRETLKKTQARLSDECKRAGRAEGELSVLREMLKTAEATIATLRKDLSEVESDLSAALDARDELLGRDA